MASSKWVLLYKNILSGAQPQKVAESPSKLGWDCQAKCLANTNWWRVLRSEDWAPATISDGSIAAKTYFLGSNYIHNFLGMLMGELCIKPLVVAWFSSQARILGMCLVIILCGPLTISCLSATPMRRPTLIGSEWNFQWSWQFLQESKTISLILWRSCNNSIDKSSISQPQLALLGYRIQTTRKNAVGQSWFLIYWHNREGC